MYDTHRILWSEVERLGVFPFGRQKSDDGKAALHSLLEDARTGAPEARSEFIQAYIPFVLRTASQATRRYIDQHHDDEFSIALMAFNEAIDRFDPTRRVNFLSFAETIIRRRLIDYFRTQKSSQKAIPFTEFEVTDEEDNVTNYVEVRASLTLHNQTLEQDERAREISEYAALLERFGLSMQDLLEASPKHSDARQNAVDVARVIVSDPELRDYVHERGTLPLKALEDRVGVSRKTMERQRKYVLAVVLLLSGDFTHLHSYIPGSSVEAAKVPH
jgi:RNA polymerase sigma factor